MVLMRNKSALRSKETNLFLYLYNENYIFAMVTVVGQVDCRPGALPIIATLLLRKAPSETSWFQL